ncbi:MAG: alternative ribosome rescue aminoacyl-tRNA hydrolase ArfB [Polyangiaceae bacterium]
MSPLPIDPALTLPATDLSIDAVRSSGPGGQNVNKVSSKVLLRFDLARSHAITEHLRARIRLMFPNRLDRDGRLFVTCDETRDQHRNHTRAREKLRGLLLLALHEPEPRVATKPSRAAKRRRLGDKRRVAEKKAGRRAPADS